MSEEVEQSQSTPESEQEPEQSAQASAFTPQKLKERKFDIFANEDIRRY